MVSLKSWAKASYISDHVNSATFGIVDGVGSTSAVTITIQISLA
jgi:hypothetical protein